MATVMTEDPTQNMIYAQWVVIVKTVVSVMRVMKTVAMEWMMIWTVPLIVMM
jgi:hypothetical protein